jgi:hypothetical protein
MKAVEAFDSWMPELVKIRRFDRHVFFGGGELRHERLETWKTSHS